METGGLYPKARLDALSDAIFGVSMTLLVLELDLPAEFQPHSSADLLGALLGLLPKFFAYALSFGVLGLRWLANVQMRHKAEYVGRQYGLWWMLYHLLVTCMPFSTMVVSRYLSEWPSIWLYAGNTALLGALSLRLLSLTPEPESRESVVDRSVSLWVLIGSSVVAMGWSFLSPQQAMFAMCLNFLQPAVSRLFKRR
jgi:uncharacterized membrane protein